MVIDNHCLLDCEKGRFKRAFRELFMSDIKSAQYHTPEKWHERLLEEGDKAIIELEKIFAWRKYLKTKRENGDSWQTVTK